MPASKAPGAGAGVATASPSHSAEALKRRLNHFYSYDGTWRQAEPSWRVKLFQRENVRGAPSEANTMNDPTLLQHLQPGRRAQAAQPPPTAPAGAVIQKSANAAAAAFCALNFKDLKLSGFANETLCHIPPNAEVDPQRWARLGINTRERLIASDKFGDIAFGDTRPIRAQSAPNPLPATYPKMMPFTSEDVPPKPGMPEGTGFTRGPRRHTAVMLQGGYVHEEPEPAAAKPPPSHVKVVGNKLSTGYRLNNHNDAAEDATNSGDAPGVRPVSVPAIQYMRTSIGTQGDFTNWHNGAGARVTKYGEMRRRKLAPQETGQDCIVLNRETSGFTRNKLHEKAGPNSKYVPPGATEITVERKLQASQIALRMMENPIEYAANPHQHKMRGNLPGATLPLRNPIGRPVTAM